MTCLYEFALGGSTLTVIPCKAEASDYFIIYLCQYFITIIVLLMFLYFTVRVLSIFKTIHTCRIVIYNSDFSKAGITIYLL